MSTPIMAMTTSSSTSVNPLDRGEVFIMIPLKLNGKIVKNQRTLERKYIIKRFAKKAYLVKKKSMFPC